MTIAFQILPNVVGQKISEFFDIVRPIIEFKFEIVLARSNNIFEIATVEPLEVLQKVSTIIVTLKNMVYQFVYMMDSSRLEKTAKVTKTMQSQHR